MDFSKKEFWLDFAKISDENSLSIESKEKIADYLLLNIKTYQQQLIKEGYVFLPEAGLGQQQQILVALSYKLLKNNLEPIFAFVYDEFWLLAKRFNKSIKALFQTEAKDIEFYMLPAFWHWHIDYQKEEAGWPPHRDRDYKALRDDGSAKALTLWLPLTEAHPLNACMYLVPANRDRHYGSTNDSSFLFDYQDVRALPCKPGDALIWNHAVLHWGGRASIKAKDNALENRLSVGFEFQSADDEQLKDFFLAPDVIPSFEDRLRLIAKQIIQYTHMKEFDKKTLDFAKEFYQKPSCAIELN